MAIVIPIVSEWNPKGLDKATAEISKAHGGWAKAGVMAKQALVPAVATLGALAVAGVAAVKSASDLQQAQGALAAVFGPATDAMTAAAKAASQIGLSQSQYSQMAAVFGAQLKNMGVSAAELAPKTQQLISLGSDLAAQFGGTTATAVESLGSLLRGETDPIEKYGVSIKEADIKTQMLADGTSKLTGAQGKAAKTAAIMTLLTKQTASSQGAAAREAGTYQARQQKLTATFENLKASIGSALLPVIEKLAGMFQGVADWAGRNTGLFLTLATVAGVLATAIVAINVGMKIQAAFSALSAMWTAISSSQRLATVSQWLLNAAMSANPIGIIIIAIIALVAIIVLAYKKNETFRKIVQAVWNGIKAAIGGLVNWFRDVAWPILKKVIAFIIAYYRVMWAAVKVVWAGIKAAISKLVGWFRDVAWPIIKKVIAFMVAYYRVLWAAVKVVWNGIKTAVGTAVGIVKKHIQTVITVAKALGSAFTTLKKGIAGAMDAIWTKVKAVGQWIGDKIQWIADKIKNVPGLSSLMGRSLSVTTTSRSLSTVSGAVFTTDPLAGSIATAGGDTFTINVTGAMMDPDGAARAIEKVLRDRAGRTGRMAY